MLFWMLVWIFAPQNDRTADWIISGGTVYDGTGEAGVVADVVIRDDRIVLIGDASPWQAKNRIDARGKAVAPGFINMLSWATESLIADGHSQSDIRQGVTLEVFGEGWSMGPLNPTMQQDIRSGQSDVKYPVAWSTLGGYLEWLANRGVSTNIASFIGATTVRIHVLGHENRKPNADELKQMKALVRQAMEEGAMGVGSSLIYAPGFFADTDELAALAEAAAAYDGMYVSHMRSESNRLLEALDELIDIAQRSGIRAEIYHLKAAGRANHGKLDEVVQRIESAHKRGLDIGANMYTYTAGATGLDASMPPWVKEGGQEAWFRRLGEPETRAKILAEMRDPKAEWENLGMLAGADKMLLADFKTPALRRYIGKTVADVAKERGTSVEETILDLVKEDRYRVGTIYFLMSEANLERQIQLPYMTFGSDGGSLAPVEPFTKSNPHPRAYGNFARLFGKYVRDRKVIPMEEAIRKLSGLAADKLNIRERGYLKPGYFADVVIFDPATIADKATFEEPHQYAVGVDHVWVNGERVLANGEHTGAKPGRVVRGPGWTGWND